ncbi:MAG: serine hydrolase [Haliscomenobacter sp.]|nr:serine hydrolase [Haliscomenobacter sp.]MBK7475119.1 serine hydrolase [Haliscomenobacter sp.]MBK8879927.1 serine hydrolase [Haliscomenobacter sp.]
MQTMAIKGIWFPLFFWLLLPGAGAQQTIPGLEQAIRKEFSRSPGTYALAFQEIRRPERQLLINEKEVFHAASTMKTPVMAEAYRQAANRKFKLSDSLTIKNEFKSIVDGSLFSLEVGVDSEEKLYQQIGEKASIYDLVYDMIIYSSNLATNIVIELLDARNVTQTMRSIGAMDIQVLRGVEDGKAYSLGKNNTTTAYDLMLLFREIAKGTLVSKKACKEMTSILLDQKFNEGIPALLPKEVKVAHKTGWITRVRHDSGIVMLPDGRKYVLVILSKGWESDELATEIMANTSKLVYDFVVANGQ